jgi:hypothetical protein
MDDTAINKNMKSKLLILIIMLASFMASDIYGQVNPSPVTRPLLAQLVGTNFEPILKIDLEPNGFGGQIVRLTWDNPTMQNWFMYESIDSMQTWPWKVNVGTNTSTLVAVGNQQRFFQLRNQ